jgi:hypothetical protein
MLLPSSGLPDKLTQQHAGCGRGLGKEPARRREADRRETRPGKYHSWVHLATDYIHPTPRGGRCRVRVYLPEEEQDAPVVICSELPTYEGSSIT